MPIVGNPRTFVPTNISCYTVWWQWQQNNTAAVLHHVYLCRFRGGGLGWGTEHSSFLSPVAYSTYACPMWQGLRNSLFLCIMSILQLGPKSDAIKCPERRYRNYLRVYLPTHMTYNYVHLQVNYIHMYAHPHPPTHPKPKTENPHPPLPLQSVVKMVSAISLWLALQLQSMMKMCLFLASTYLRWLLPYLSVAKWNFNITGSTIMISLIHKLSEINTESGKARATTWVPMFMHAQHHNTLVWYTT